MKEKIKKNLEEQEHLDFLEKENFGTNIFPDKSRLLKIIIAPLSLSQKQVNYQEIKGWLKENSYGHYSWNPFLNGVRTVNRFIQDIKNSGGQKISTKEIPISIILLFHNATVSLCCKLEYPREEEDISIGWITGNVKDILDFTSKFYKKIEFFEPVKIYVQLINVKGLPANLNIDTFHRMNWNFLSLLFEKRWLNENLIFNENSSGKEIIENPNEITKKISNRLVQTFGIWEAPSQYFKE